MKLHEYFKSTIELAKQLALDSNELVINPSVTYYSGYKNGETHIECCFGVLPIRDMYRRGMAIPEGMLREVEILNLLAAGRLEEAEKLTPLGVDMEKFKKYCPKDVIFNLKHSSLYHRKLDDKKVLNDYLHDLMSLQTSMFLAS